MIAGIELDGALGDVTYLAITVALFGVARLLMAACQRIAGSEESAGAAAHPAAPSAGGRPDGTDAAVVAA